ncbi:MAG: adenylyl-sulfate kinase [Betaproteobacteria bacterium]
MQIVEAGLIVVTAFVSPFRRDRDVARGLLLYGGFLEIYRRCSRTEARSEVEECEVDAAISYI